MRRLLILVLLSFLLVGCSGETGNLEKYDCYNANFGDSVEDVKSIREITFIEERQATKYDLEKGVEIEDPTERLLDFKGKIFDTEGNFIYYFDAKENSLFALFISLRGNSFCEDYQESLKVLEEFKEKLNDIYGEPYYKSEFERIEGLPYSYFFEYDWASHNTHISLDASLKEDNSYDQGIYIMFSDIDKTQELGIHGF